MRRHSRIALAVVLLLALAVTIPGCWGKKRSSTGVAQVAALQGCPPVDIVFVMDTSGSMNGIAAEICTDISTVRANLLARGLSDIQTTLLGINENPGGDFSCLQDNVLNLLGEVVPGAPFPGNELLDQYEDWGPGSTIVAERFAWRAGSLRIVVPISDEGAENGGTGVEMCDEDDTQAMVNLSSVALASNVVVSPVWGSDDHPGGAIEPCLLTELQNIATTTGGTVTLYPDPTTTISDALFDLVVAACEGQQNGGETAP